MSVDPDAHTSPVESDSPTPAPSDSSSANASAIPEAELEVIRARARDLAAKAPPLTEGNKSAIRVLLRDTSIEMIEQAA